MTDQTSLSPPRPLHRRDRRHEALAQSPHPDLGGASRATGGQSREGREASHRTKAGARPTLTARRRALPESQSGRGGGSGETEQGPAAGAQAVAGGPGPRKAGGTGTTIAASTAASPPKFSRLSRTALRRCRHLFNDLSREKLSAQTRDTDNWG